MQSWKSRQWLQSQWQCRYDTLRLIAGAVYGSVGTGNNESAISGNAARRKTRSKLLAYLCMASPRVAHRPESIHSIACMLNGSGRHLMTDLQCRGPTCKALARPLAAARHAVSTHSASTESAPSEHPVSTEIESARSEHRIRTQ